MPLTATEKMLALTIRTLQEEHNFNLKEATDATFSRDKQIEEWMALGLNEFSIADMISDEVDEQAKREEQGVVPTTSQPVSTGNETGNETGNPSPSRPAPTPPTRIILHGHTSESTGLLQYDYPFGFQLRCLRRLWIEKAEKGGKKGEWRFAAQTTERTWNHKYTDAGAPKTKEECTAAGLSSPFWNKPKYSTYSHFMVLYQDLTKTDEVGAPYIFYASTGLYDGADRLYNFYDAWWSQMNEQERQEFLALVKRSFRVNGPVYWQKEQDRMARHELGELIKVGTPTK